MSENFRKYFILNGEVKEDVYFDDNIITRGKSLYEVIRIIDGYPLFLKRHMKRLKNSARVTDLKLWLNEEQIKSCIFKLIEVNGEDIGNIKLIFNYYNGELNFLCYYIKHNYPDKKSYEEGVKTILYHGERNNPNAKVINMDFRHNVDIKIKESSAYEAILVDNQGFITEGSRSNIFLIKGNKVYTAPLKAVLPGTRRDVIIHLCKKLSYEVIEKEINYKDIADFDALFISGTSPKVLPINKVDNIDYNSSKNAVVKNLMNAYDQEVTMDIEEFKNNK
ncbi:aminotransferase class IV [Clostridium sp. JN-9]|uniref:aminotransferase class IV n=1 Tax=Clostridium sp. JN-9 TaxID=2507159 RepID=UPI000FFE11B7|nr:aminotransferase class IV [Clostridium sp. JN-9]QAT40564.1 aminotransferase class IV [Clostridium sp. JN-9]